LRKIIVTIVAADWVQFCNQPDNALRARCGHTESLNVKLCELENEMYSRYDAITYAQWLMRTGFMPYRAEFIPAEWLMPYIQAGD
jgi:alpha-L-arabinofuranosidase